MISSKKNIPIERIDPSIKNASDYTIQHHIDRYRIASTYAKPGRILDIACGTGYGTQILATQSDKRYLIGVDKDIGALKTARKHYNHERIYYQQSTIEDFMTPYPLSTIVCFETIEHVKDPVKVCKKLVSMLGDSGVLIMSVPLNDVEENPYHLHEFTEKSFREMFKKDLKIIAEFNQIHYLTLIGIDKKGT